MIAMRLSYSAISAYQSCPLQYRFRYVDRLPSKPSAALEFGSALHKALHELYAKDRSLDDTRALLWRIWESTEVLKNETEPRYSLAAAVSTIENFYVENFKQDGKPFVIPHALEEWFEIGLDGHQLVGRIDRIDTLEDGNHEIIDYKTGKRLPSQADLDKDLQLSIYYWAAHDTMKDINPERLKLYFLRPDSNEQCVTSRVPDRIMETREIVYDVINRIEADKAGDAFNPVKNPLCGWCDYQAECASHIASVKQEATDNPSLFDDEEENDIREVVDAYIEFKDEQDELKSRMSELEAMIEKHCVDNDVREVEGHKGKIERIPGGMIRIVSKKK